MTRPQSSAPQNGFFITAGSLDGFPVAAVPGSLPHAPRRLLPALLGGVLVAVAVAIGSARIATPAEDSAVMRDPASAKRVERRPAVVKRRPDRAVPAVRRDRPKRRAQAVPVTRTRQPRPVVRTVRPSVPAAPPRTRPASPPESTAGAGEFF